MSEHTPGPWEASGLTVYDTCMDAVASVHSAADAHLIAAAPDMLEALAARREAREFSASVSAATPDGEPVAKHLMDKADLLFAKAARLEDAALVKIEAPTA